MVRVSGVPYEVELVDQYMNDISELERENFMLRARIERLEEELRTTNELLTKLNFELINERNNNASRKP
jgi:vacuolar-type H+-ATPase subunit I/STV1